MSEPSRSGPTPLRGDIADHLNLDEFDSAFVAQHELNLRFIGGALSDPNTPEEGRFGKASARTALEFLRDKARMAELHKKIAENERLISQAKAERAVLKRVLGGQWRHLSRGARHRRAPGTKPVRHRGSRRVSASAGSRGDPDDDPGPADPAPGSTWQTQQGAADPALAGAT